MRPLVVSAIAASMLAGFAAIAAAQVPQMYKPGPGPDDLWDVTMKMDIVGMPMQMPAQSMKVCTKKERGSAGMLPTDKNCTVSDVRNVGNKMTFRMACTGENAMTGSGEITQTADSYSGVMRAKSTRKGEEMEMTQTYSGKRVGTCTDQSQQVVAAVRKQGDDQLAKVCTDSVSALSYLVFEQGQCGEYRKQFCDKAMGVGREMREPAGHVAAMKAYNGHSLKGALAMCGADLGAITAVACGRGVETRNWSFVANGSCDSDVRAQGDMMCKGRSFTGMDRNVVPLCSRYAGLQRGGSRASGDDAAPGSVPASAAAAAQPQQPDPVKSGLDAVRKLLPF